MTDRLRFAFLEIGRFDKTMDECVRFEEKFLFMMKNMPKFAETPGLWDDPYFQSMLDEAEFARMTEREKELYRKAMRRDWDYWNTIDCARQEGKAEGRAEGLSEGRAEGLAEGEAKGKVAGRAEGLAEGEAKGKVAGRAEGLAEGEAKGKAEGLAEGRAEEQRTIARRLLAAGLAVELVAEGTGLSAEEVIALQDS